MVLWSRDYNKVVFDRFGENFLAETRNTSFYYFPTKSGLRTTRYFCETYGAESVLDYGCGNFDNIVVPDGVTVAYYDPFVESRKARPSNKFDVVFLNHVLNGVEPDFLEEVLEDVKSFCDKAIVSLNRLPGIYGVGKSDYHEKFHRRGLIVKEELVCSWNSFITAVRSREFNKNLQSSGNRNEDALYYALLEKDPNF